MPGQATRCAFSLHLAVTNEVHAADAEAGRCQDVIQHAFGSYTYQDLLLAAAYLRQHIAALHQEVRSSDEQTCPQPLGVIAFAAQPAAPRLDTPIGHACVNTPADHCKCGRYVDPG